MPKGEDPVIRRCARGGASGNFKDPPVQHSFEFAEKYLGMEKGGERGYGSRILRENAKMYGGNCNVKIDREKKIYKSTVILDAAGTGAEEERGRTA